MEEIPASEAPFPSPSRRRPDLLSALMVAVTAVFLLVTAWIRFGPSPKPSGPAVGDEAPPIRLLDLDRGEPIVLLGLGEKVVWLTFWSSKTAEGHAGIDRIDRIWKGLSGYRKFAMAASAVDVADPQAVRKLVAADRLKLPVYLASPETCRDFGVEPGALPLHFVIDVDGRILATSQGRGEAALDEIEEIVRSRLRVLDPSGGARFAGLRDPGSGLALSQVRRDVSVANDRESR